MVALLLYIFVLISNVSIITASDTYNTEEWFANRPEADQSRIAGQILSTLLNDLNQHDHQRNMVLYGLSASSMRPMNNMQMQSPYIHPIGGYNDSLSSIELYQQDGIHNLPEILFATSGSDPWTAHSNSTLQINISEARRNVEEQIGRLQNKEKSLLLDHYSLNDMYDAACYIVKTCCSLSTKIISNSFSYLTTCKSIILSPFNRRHALTLINTCYKQALKSLNETEIDSTKRTTSIGKLTKIQEKLVNQVHTVKSTELTKINTVTHIEEAFKEALQKSTCPVCWDEFSDAVTQCTLKCNHLLCTSCFQRLEKSTCPLCRGAI